MGLSYALGELDLPSLPEEERGTILPAWLQYKVLDFQVSPKLCTCPEPQERTFGAGMQQADTISGVHIPFLCVSLNKSKGKRVSAQL